MATTHEQILGTLIAYFKDIFSTASPNSSTLSVHIPFPGDQTTPHQQYQDERGAMASPPQQQQDMSIYTNSKPSIQEIHSIIKNMRSNASPRPDGLNAAFYKAGWSWISNDVHNLVGMEFHQGYPHASGTSRPLHQPHPRLYFYSHFLYFSKW